MAGGELWWKRILGKASRATGLLDRDWAELESIGTQPGGGDGDLPVGPSVPPAVAHSRAPPSYRLAAFAVLTWVVALLLAGLDEYWSLPHAASLNAVLFFMAVLVIFSLLLTLRRLRAWRAHSLNSAEFRDQVTGLPNYRYLLLRLEEEASRARRFRRPLALTLVDISSLRSVNAEYGLSCGDQLLCHVAGVIQGCLRSTDMAARLVGDRFAIIAPECDEQGARAVIERLEEHFSRTPAEVEVDGQPLHLWVAICTAVADMREESDDTGELIHRAEASLLAAKEERDKRRKLWLSA